MHNGWIPYFEKIKRQIHHLLEDDIYNWIKGTTDSELIFALFLQLSKQKKIKNSQDIHTVLLEALTLITNLVKKNHQKAVCYFNICITNGKHLVAFRYCTSSQAKPETMYFCRNKNSPSDCVIIASEKLSTKEIEWKIIPRNHSLLIESDFKLSLKEL